MKIFLVSSAVWTDNNKNNENIIIYNNKNNNYRSHQMTTQHTGYIGKFKA